MSRAATKPEKSKGNRGLKTGSIFKEVERDERGRISRTYYIIRKRYTDSNGRAREMKRIANSYADALEKRQEIEEQIEIERRALKEPELERTFDDLVAYYNQHYLIPPQYVGNVKVAGCRSHEKLKSILRPIAAWFGGRPLAGITYDDVREYRRVRLATPASVCRKVDCETHKNGRQRSLASVHRELQLLRAMLNVAMLTKKWISENPFKAGKPIINADDETKRMRILTHDEERRLLAACGDRTAVVVWRGREVTQNYSEKARAHLRPALILSIDTAARHGEEFCLRWSDWDRDGQIITIQSWISKTGHERIVPVTDRLRRVLETLWDNSEKDPDALIMPHRSVKRSFAGACRAALITGYRWHDNRHTGIVWMLEAGIPGEKVMKITGHTQIKTFLRYLNLNAETARSAASLMNARRETMDAQDAT